MDPSLRWGDEGELVLRNPRRRRNVQIVQPKRGYPMLLTIAAILVILWLLGFAAFHVAGGLIHILLVIAIIVVIVHFIRGR
jgi:hypothetical protein